jgi:ectoine hydroxylase-related dioxygenase (phytanoyl-CoA dioxygenase family)
LITYTELNEFNAAKITVNLPTGSLILFPSKLFHQVPENKETEDRITLAFNSFLKGKLGGPTSFLGELKL